MDDGRVKGKLKFKYTVTGNSISEINEKAIHIILEIQS